MSSTRGIFDVRILGGRGHEQHLSPFAVITMGGTDISEHLGTDSEIDHRVSRIKEELDAIAKTAKKKLAQAREL